jgi:hypothetical protein
MSAYICNPEHFGILAWFAVKTNCVISEWVRSRQPGAATSIANAQSVAIGLARENIRSVAHRYPDAEEGHRPGPSLLDAEIEEAAALFAAHFIAHPTRVKPIEIIKLVRSLDYQCCETDDWPLTLAFRQLDWILGEALRQLPGYANARWSLEQKIPAVEALYERRAA